MQFTRVVKVKNKLGLHARPAAMIVKMLEEFEGDVLFSRGAEEVDARSVLHILQLAATEGTEISITAHGNHAERILTVLEEAFASAFGECT